MRIGIYGGSFNPVHNGHIRLAETAAAEFGLDRVYLVPSKISPHRSIDEYVSEADRLAMLALAAGQSEKLRVSSYELDADRVSYSVYTVEHFRRLFPDDELVLLCGSDMMMIIDKWYRFEDIVREVTIGVISRNEGDREQLEAKAAELRKYGPVLVSEAAPLEVSSTDIRKKIAKNENFACYLDENVVQYIRLRNLYSSGE